MKEKYSKAELMLYYRRVNYTINSGYKKYYFDNNANITNIHINGYDNKATNCEFWGMLPDDTQIACYYYKKSDGTYVVLNSLMYENELIKDKVSIWNKDGGGSYRNEGLAKKSRDAVLKSTETNSTYDNTKLKPSQTNTEEANKWKEQMTNKTFKGKIPFYDATFNFDNIGNLTIKYTKNNTTEINDICTFWGATNYYNDLLGIYYIKIDLKDIFGIIAPNESTYFYYGYVLEYESRFPKAIERGQDSFYITNSINWYEKYFDKSGNPKRTIDWASMIIQESRYISFGNTQENILLFEKQK